MADYNRRSKMLPDLAAERDAKRQDLHDAMERSKPVKAKRSRISKTRQRNSSSSFSASRTSTAATRRTPPWSERRRAGREIETKLTEVGTLTRKDQDRARRVQELRKEIADRTAQLATSQRSRHCRDRT